MITTQFPSGLPASFYSLVLGYAVMIGLWLSLTEFEDQDRGFEQLLAMLVGAFTGARLLYVVEAWDYYRMHIMQALLPVGGGYDWFGAIAGALAASLLVALLTREKWLPLLDRSTFLWLSLTIAVWLNAVLSETGYGSPIDMGFAFSDEDILAFPTTKISLSFIGLTGTFLLWAVLESFIEPRVKDIHGGRFASIMVGLMVIVLLVNTLRDDAARMLNRVYFDIYLAAGMLTLFLLLGIGLVRKHNKPA